MKTAKKLNIFIYSDTKAIGNGLNSFLQQYSDYKLSFIPTEFALFDLMKWEPDIIVLDNEARKVVKCHEWAA